MATISVRLTYFDPAALRHRRKRAKLTQVAFSERLGMQQSNYNNLETGYRGPSMEVVRQMADALRIEPRFLFVRLLKGEQTLRWIRETQALTQTELAEQLGLKFTTWTEIERGSNTPARHLSKIAATLGITEEHAMAAWERGAIERERRHDNSTATHHDDKPVG